MRLNQFTESAESPAQKEAQAKGLTYKGFGYWADSTGKVVARSHGDKLEPVGKKDGGKEEEKANAPEEGKIGGALNAYDDVVRAGQNPEIVLGKTLPGEEKAPKDGNWTPGPDGDNMVDSPEETDVEDDAFVDKGEDSDRWVAGADGNNYKKIKSFDDVKEAAEEQQLSLGFKKTPHELARDRGLKSDGHGYWVDNSGNPVAKTDGEELVDLSREDLKRYELGSRMPGRTTMRDMVKGNRPIEGPMKLQLAPVAGALANIGKTERDKYIDDKAATRDDEYMKGDDKGPYRKALDFQKQMAHMGQSDYEDQKKVEELNEFSQEYYQDPNYDLDNVGEELGDGAFGTVWMGPDNQSVIKAGEIGRVEMMALDKLQQIEGFPSLLNGRFETPFRAKEDQLTSQEDSEDVLGDTFWNQQETATGRFAMSLARGGPIYDATMSFDEITHETVAQDFWQKMIAMHKMGISHNDLHGGNVFYDDETGEINILDLGLADTDSITALYEALGSQSGENYQLTAELSLDFLPQEMQDQLEANRAALIDRVSEDFSGDEWSDEETGLLEEFMTGGIRMTADMKSEFNELFTEDQIKEYIDILYDGLGEDPRSDLQQRMDKGYQGMLDKIAAAKGFRSGEAAADMFRAADDMAVEKGEGRIPFKGVDITRNPAK